MSRTSHHRRRPRPPGTPPKAGIHTIVYLWEPNPASPPRLVRAEYGGRRWWYSFTDDALNRVGPLLNAAAKRGVISRSERSEDAIRVVGPPGTHIRRLRDSISAILGKPYHRPI
jgi:hypothetical protein